MQISDLWNIIDRAQYLNTVFYIPVEFLCRFLFTMLNPYGQHSWQEDRQNTAQIVRCPLVFNGVDMEKPFDMTDILSVVFAQNFHMIVFGQDLNKLILLHKRFNQQKKRIMGTVRPGGCGDFKQIPEDTVALVFQHIHNIVEEPIKGTPADG